MNARLEELKNKHRNGGSMGNGLVVCAFDGSEILEFFKFRAKEAAKEELTPAEEARYIVILENAALIVRQIDEHRNFVAKHDKLRKLTQLHP